MVNGDKLVLNKLDEQINVIKEEEEDDNDIEYKKVSIDYQGLVDKDSTVDNILKDLLDLPSKNISKVLLINSVTILMLHKQKYFI